MDLASSYIFIAVEKFIGKIIIKQIEYILKNMGWAKIRIYLGAYSTG